jgi:Uma2 family endonuclease
MEQAVTQIGIAMDEFIRLYDKEGPFELINGERRLKMPNVAGHGFVAELMRDSINQWSIPNNLGRAMLEQSFVISYTSNWVTGSRIPDVMYYRAGRLETYKSADPDWKRKPYILVPDLVIEVVSPTDDLRELDDKIDLYLADGVLMVWVVDALREKVSVYTLIADQPNTKRQTTLKQGDLLTGGDIIPGFELAVASIFTAG